MGVEKVTDQSFDADVLASKTPVLVDFWAQWCGPCHMVAPILEDLAVELGDKVKIVKLDIEADPLTTTKFGIMSIPTLLLFKDGKIISRKVGAADKVKLTQWLTSSL